MNTYGLAPNYQARPKPEYFNDTLNNANLWQADVYKLADSLSRQNNLWSIVDIGCGRAGKLIPLAYEHEIVGFDYGENIAYLREHMPIVQWNEADLEHEIIPAEKFERSVVICADVIEHLIDPSALVGTLKNAVSTAAYVLLSTPDRVRMYGGEQNGPPSNPAHVREWTLSELAKWLSGEGLPIVWAGWTVSFQGQPDNKNTSLLVLSNNFNRLDLPNIYEQGLEWAGYAPMQSAPKEWAAVEPMPMPPSNVLKVWMTPTPNEASRDITNAINQIVVRVNQYLPEFGVQLVEEPNQAHLYAAHAGQGSQDPVDVCHFHGLYNTAQGSDNFAINREVIKNLKWAYKVTSPSQWIADVLRRDMHIDPKVIGWGVDTEQWTPVSHVKPDYVIWNKARVDNVSNPALMLELAAKARDVLFLTTFGSGTSNVKTIGRQPYEVMKNYVRNAAVYLSTNVETFGIGLMEAMSAGVPVLSFRQGAQVDYIIHGVNGFLAEPHDMEGLHKGLLYCLEHRERLGANARVTAKDYTWRKVAQEFAKVYYEVMDIKKDIRPHLIDEALYKIQSAMN